VPEKYRKALPRPKLKGVKMIVVKDAELLSQDKKRVFKQIFPDLYVALHTEDYPGDTLTMKWRLGL
jgi:hypothetical protein